MLALLGMLVVPICCAKARVEERGELVHEYIILGMWLLLGVLTGIFF